MTLECPPSSPQRIEGIPVCREFIFSPFVLELSSKYHKPVDPSEGCGGGAEGVFFFSEFYVLVSPYSSVPVQRFEGLRSSEEGSERAQTLSGTT